MAVAAQQYPPVVPPKKPMVQAVGGGMQSTAPQAIAPPPTGQATVGLRATPATQDATGRTTGTTPDPGIVNAANGLPPGTMIDTTNGTPNGYGPTGPNGTNGSGGGGVGAYLHGVVNAIPGPAQVDNSPLRQSMATSNGLVNGLGVQRDQAAANPNAAPAAWTPQLANGQIDPLRQQQQGALGMLQSAAQGNTPSVAELQQQQAGNRAAAQQFGMASALQGGNSAGNALRQASEGAANLQADTANNNAQLRAGETSNARGQLVSGLQGVRGQEQDLAGQNAGLQQQTNLANLNAQLTTTGQNQDWQKALLSGQLQANQTATAGAGALADANAKTAAATNQYNSSYVGAGGNLIKKILPF